VIPKEDLSGLIKFLQGNVLSRKESERKWFADQILTVFRHRLADFMEVEVGECIQFLVRHGFFESKSLAKPEQLMIREKLFSLLSSMTSDSLQVWSRYSVIEIAANEKTNDRVVKLDSQIKKIRKSALKCMDHLSSAVRIPLRKAHIRTSRGNHNKFVGWRRSSLWRYYNCTMEIPKLYRFYKCLFLKILLIERTWNRVMIRSLSKGRCGPKY
jgi:hypothetical protein